MAISARLSRTLHQELGDEAAEDLVNWMVQMEVNRSDLRDMMDGYMARLDRQFEGFDKRFAQMDQRFEKMDQRFEKIDAKFERVDERFEQVHRDISGLETRMSNRFADLFKWSFVFWCGAVGAIALLARALR